MREDSMLRFVLDLFTMVAVSVVIFIAMFAAAEWAACAVWDGHTGFECRITDPLFLEGMVGFTTMAFLIVLAKGAFGCGCWICRIIWNKHKETQHEG